MSACSRICWGDAPPPCTDKDLSVTCNVAPPSVCGHATSPRLVKQRTERDRLVVGGSSVGDTDGVIARFYLCAELSAHLIFILRLSRFYVVYPAVGGEKSVSYLKVSFLGNIDICPADAREMQKQGLELGCAVWTLMVFKGYVCNILRL